MEGSYAVYIKNNELCYITDVSSSAFLTDTDGWTEIDRGYGDRYHHAQGNYFPDPIFTDRGACRYKLMDGVCVNCTEEIKKQETAAQCTETISLQDRIAELEAQNELLMQCLLELSEVVYA